MTVGHRYEALLPYGSDSGPLGLVADVEIAQTDGKGNVGPFALSAESLPEPRQQLASAATDQFLFVTGGSLGQTPDTVSADVLSAPRNIDGSLGPWTKSPQRIVTPRFLHQMATYNGNLIVVGGLSANDTFLNDVQVAKVDADGSVEAFTETQPFPGPGRWAFGCVVVGDTIYVLGGSGASSYLSDVYYAKLAPDGTIPPSAWQMGVSLPVPAGLAYFALAAD